MYDNSVIMSKNDLRATFCSLFVAAEGQKELFSNIIRQKRCPRATLRQSIFLKFRSLCLINAMVSTDRSISTFRKNTFCTMLIQAPITTTLPVELSGSFLSSFPYISPPFSIQDKIVLNAFHKKVLIMFNYFEQYKCNALITNDFTAKNISDLCTLGLLVIKAPLM